MTARFADVAEALDIALPKGGGLVLDGCRRLTGPNLFADGTGAVGDVLCPGHDPGKVLALWEGEARALMAPLGWPEAPVRSRLFEAGASLFLPAPEDQLMTATYVIEAAWHRAAHQLLGSPALPQAALAGDLVRVSAMEANPRLLALLAQARARGIDRLLDDDHVTFGHGARGATWPHEALPEAADWDRLGNIPLALVTGTNGKTTTTRLLAAMGAAAGLVAGLSSTDFVRVGEDILDRGDYSGPAGARLLLRDSRARLAVLEVARGGILRRGLPVTRAKVAVVTNVAADHLGQYGINSVAELAEVKLAVRRGLAPGGWLILNAGDPVLAAAADAMALSPCWFSAEAGDPRLVAARARGIPCAWAEAGMLRLSQGGDLSDLLPLAEVPLTLGGAARYNIENALAAALAARGLGLPDSAIRAALRAFHSDRKDNPGRANEFVVAGARVFVDFAHNPHSIAAVTSALAALPAARRIVMLSHAGDRSDAEIRALASGAFALGPDLVVIAENPKYLRGREPGAVPALFEEACLALGLPRSQILHAASPLAGAEAVADRLRPGDLALLLVHDERQAVFDLLEARAG